jgi:hypothetical protein
MLSGLRPCLILLLGSSVLTASDPYCPAYSPDARARFRAAEARVRNFYAYSALHARKAVPDGRGSESNPIDGYIFGKMQTDGVAQAPPSSDPEFLRRIYLDLTGRLPTAEQAQAFLSSTDDNRRTALIDQLLASGAYVDKWTLFYGNIFQVTSGYYNFISIQSRNRFYQYLHEFISSDRSYADVAREMITASGDSYLTGPPNYIVRALQQGDPVQDTWDTLTDQTTVALVPRSHRRRCCRRWQSTNRKGLSRRTQRSRGAIAADGW